MSDSKVGFNALQLGAVPLSPDLLAKANIGIWAFEMDEGKPPRMYVDDTMLGLVGLAEQVPPEQTYHAWYDHIDEGSYGLVADAVEKMVAGVHAEVQYPWHHPDGRTMIVRCGGVRNFQYTAGVRIEGTHQDVSQISHLDEETLRRVHQQERTIKYTALKADALAYLVDHTAGIKEFLDCFGDRLLEISGCDQVIYRDLKGRTTAYNAPGIRTVSSDVCNGCQFSCVTADVYADGVLRMDDCTLGANGMKPKCGAKSSVMHQIYANGKLSGLLSFRYIKELHAFTEEELGMLKTVSTYLGLLLDRLEAKKVKDEMERMQRKEHLEIIEGLASEYVGLYHIDIDQASFKFYSIDDGRISDTRKIVSENANAFDALRLFAQKAVHPDDRRLFLELTPETVREALANRKKFTLRFRRNYGSGYLWSEMDVVKDNAKDEPATSVIIGFAERDKEIRKEQEREKQLSNALDMAQRANIAKTVFLNSMSHDIRTPMNAIVGYTSMAQKYIADREKVHDYLGKISIAGGNLLNLVNQVLDMSRIESGKVVLAEEPADVLERAHEMTEIMGSAAAAKGVSMSMRIRNVPQRKVYADVGRVNQLIMNVLGNAVKYTPEGGSIVYEVEQIQCGKPGYGTYVFAIEDNGIGMSKEFVASIFEPFSRENTSTVSKIQGTGLGMTIVKKLVDLMGGTIVVDSEPGRGTKITMTLTLRLQEDASAEGEEQCAEADYTVLRGKRVLLVEDNEMNREIATMLLEEQGIVVETAEDGDVAVEMARAVAERGEWDYYDFVLMDIQMPRMTGYVATKHIRSIPAPKGVHLPIIAMTANAFAEDRQLCLAAGMDAHIAKPIDVQALWETLVKFSRK